MSVFIGCGCASFDSSCWICRDGLRAYRSGRRAYKQGKSRHGGPNHGLAYRWRDGWEDGRKDNPNVATRRVKEEAAIKAVERNRLLRERAALDRRIKTLTP
jgi:hypothetical protein